MPVVRKLSLPRSKSPPTHDPALPRQRLPPPSTTSTTPTSEETASRFASHEVIHGSKLNQHNLCKSSQLGKPNTELDIGHQFPSKADEEVKTDSAAQLYRQLALYMRSPGSLSAGQAVPEGLADRGYGKVGATNIVQFLSMSVVPDLPSPWEEHAYHLTYEATYNILVPGLTLVQDDINVQKVNPSTTLLS